MEFQRVEFGGREVSDFEFDEIESDQLFIESEKRLGCEDAAVHVNVFVGPANRSAKLQCSGIRVWDIRPDNTGIVRPSVPYRGGVDIFGDFVRNEVIRLPKTGLTESSQMSVHQVTDLRRSPIDVECEALIRNDQRENPSRTEDRRYVKEPRDRVRYVLNEVRCDHIVEGSAVGYDLMDPESVAHDEVDLYDLIETAFHDWVGGVFAA